LNIIPQSFVFIHKISSFLDAILIKCASFLQTQTSETCNVMSADYKLMGILKWVLEPQSSIRITWYLGTTVKRKNSSKLSKL